MLNSQERVKAAISRQPLDRIPRGELVIDDQLIRRHLNSGSVGFEERAAFIEELGLDLVTLAPAYPGGPEIPGRLEAPLPDLERWALETPLFTFALLDGAFGWGTRTQGYTEFLMMLSRSSSRSCRDLIEKVEKLNGALIDSLIGRGIDGIIMADDIAYTRGLMVSPDMLREHFFPSLARQLEAAWGRVPVFFHSDGNYAQIIPDLIGCGFRGLQCFERQAGMEPRELKKSYPELCLWGTLEVDDLERAGEPAHLEKLASEITALSQGQGFILGTTCGLFPGIDLPGLKAIYRAAGLP